MPKGKNLDGHGSLLGYEFYKLRNMKSFSFVFFLHKLVNKSL